MAVSLDRAHNFVYQNGTLWERALFAYVIEGRTRERVWQCLAAYQNSDGGWGHGIEHDIRTPDSNAASTENALGAMLDFGLAEREPLESTARWIESQQNREHSIPWPESLHRYPHAPWWGPDGLGGQPWPPDALTGRLAALGYATPVLLRRAANWAKEHLKVETFESEVAKGYSAVYSFYHYADYYLGASQAFAPDIAQAWAQRISEALVVLAQDAEEVQAGDLLLWLMRYPASLKALLPQSEVDRHLDALQAGQQENGAWLDRHNLLVWQPVQTIWALKTLRDSGRL